MSLEWVTLEWAVLGSAAIPAALYFRNWFVFRAPPPLLDTAAPRSVSVLIPARNEEATIARALQNFPEALARFGEPLINDGGSGSTQDQWSAEVARRLEQAQDRLAEDSIARRATAFETVMDGNAGVGGMYEAWRRLRARLRGERFRRAHGGEPT